MDTERNALWWVGIGACLIAGAIFNFAVNLNSVPSILSWDASPELLEVILIGAVGVALVWYGSRMYDRVHGIRTS